MRLTTKDSCERIIFACGMSDLSLEQASEKEWTQQWRRDDAASILYPMGLTQAVLIAGYLAD